MMPMKLNLGCGDDKREGFVNIDLREDVADVVGNVQSLPYADGTVTEILASDILEHLPPTRTMPTLQEWHRVLQQGGTLIVRVPNLLQLARWIVENYQVQAAITNIYGGHKFGPDGEWDHHCTGWTPERLEAVLHKAGFDVIDNDFALNQTVTAKKAREFDE